VGIWLYRDEEAANPNYFDLLYEEEKVYEEDENPRKYTVVLRKRSC
jgi:hypothetical protein